MNPTTPDGVFELIDRYVASAAVGAAMEHGLFWLLADGPLTATDVAAATGIPEERCRPWLQLIAGLGLLDQGSGGYSASAAARKAIIEAFSRETWAFLAREARERFPAVLDLAVRLPEPGTPWEAQGLDPPNYLAKMIDDPQRAAEFTRMLYEVHLPLADQIADLVPLDGCRQVLDVGGGSGVVSLAMLRRQPGLAALVVDIANVCKEGSRIAAENGLADRIDYRPLDFVADDLPGGFDIVLYCDVGPHTAEMFRKMRESLVPGGRLVVVDKPGEGDGLAHPSRAHWALLGALSGSVTRRHSAGDIVERMLAAGFNDPSATELPPVGSRYASGWTMFVAVA